MVYLLSLKKLLSGGDFLKRYLIEKTSLRLLVVVTVFSFLFFILSGFYMTAAAVANPSAVLYLIHDCSTFLITFAATPLFFSLFFVNLSKIFDLFKQEKERKLADGDI